MKYSLYRCGDMGNRLQDMFTRVGLLLTAPTVDPGGAVPPDAPHQPQTVRLYTAQVAVDLAPKPAAPYSGSTQR